jgi:broad specificity phosphatase PhoE
MHRCTPLTDTICTQAVHALYTDFRLQERDFGVYTGRTKRQMLDLFQSDNPKDPAGENFSEWMDRE